MALADKNTPDLNGGSAINVLPRRGTTIAADGAITIGAGSVHITKAGVCAITIDDPSVTMDYAQLFIVSETANAHTVTNATGFNGLGTSGDVATFGGAKGDGMLLEARNGAWWVLYTRNVTLA